MTADVKAVICMPCDHPIAPEASNSFAGVYGQGLLDGTVIGRTIGAHGTLARTRNVLVYEALKLSPRPTHIFWMDSDMLVPPGAVAHLAAHDKPIVGGLYHLKRQPFNPVAYRWVSEDRLRMIDLPDDPHGLVSVDGMGLGCALIALDVYTSMAAHYADDIWHAFRDGDGEDVHFFKRAKEMGYEVWLETDLRCGHVRREAIFTENYEAFRRPGNPLSASAETSKGEA